MQNQIYENSITNNDMGVDLAMSFFNFVQRNNFIENILNAGFVWSILNFWMRNYWDDWSGFGPKRIPGTFPTLWNLSKVIPWTNFDWFPVQEPYAWENTLKGKV